MTHDAIPARLTVVVAEYESDSAGWGKCPKGDDEHRAERRGPNRPVSGEQPSEVRQGWEGACTACGEPIPWDSGEVYGGSGNTRVYDTPSGRLEPGCLFWVDQHSDHPCYARWENCDGQHLHGVLPNGRYWDIDSRAGNCGSPDDRQHRCWVRHGEPPAVHVDKAGLTCTAGAGSIVGGDYHGFLHHGTFTAG